MRHLFAASMLLILIAAPAVALDRGQWNGQEEATRRWFESLRQPDTNISCCGEADGYWADEVETGSSGEIIATVTDDRPDEPLRRAHVPVGTKIVVPAHKITWKHGNPTGHMWLFLNLNREVYCFVQNGGV